MEARIIYKEASDHARAVREFMRDFERQTGKQLVAIDPDSPDGSAFCEVHDIIEYPTIIVMDSEGRQQQLWRGLPLPTISEVSYYVS